MVHVERELCPDTAGVLDQTDSCSMSRHVQRVDDLRRSRRWGKFISHSCTCASYYVVFEMSCKALLWRTDHPLIHSVLLCDKEWYQSISGVKLHVPPGSQTFSPAQSFEVGRSWSRQSEAPGQCWQIYRLMERQMGNNMIINQCVGDVDVDSADLPRWTPDVYTVDPCALS